MLVATTLLLAAARSAPAAMAPNGGTTAQQRVLALNGANPFATYSAKRLSSHNVGGCYNAPSPADVRIHSRWRGHDTMLAASVCTSSMRCTSAHLIR